MVENINILKKVYLPNQGLENPDHPQNKGKKHFEIRLKKRSDGSFEKHIFINGELLDYTIDASDYARAVTMGFKKDVQFGIVKHFCDSVSEVVGRKITVADITEAYKTNWI